MERLTTFTRKAHIFFFFLIEKIFSIRCIRLSTVYREADYLVIEQPYTFIYVTIHQTRKWHAMLPNINSIMIVVCYIIVHFPGSYNVGPWVVAKT